MPAPTVSDFRSTFPEFADDLYSDDQVTTWLTFAQSMVNECRWGSLYGLGVSLVAAHNLYLGAKNQDAALGGGTPGEVTGSVASKSIDKVSVGYADNATFEGAGDWNLSTYGVRYLRTARQMGAGGLQL